METLDIPYYFLRSCYGLTALLWFAILLCNWSEPLASYDGRTRDPSNVY